MNFQPAPLNGKLQAGAVLSGRALVVEQEGAVEFLDVDPALLNWLEACACSSKRRAAFSGSANGRSTVSFKIKISRFPMPGEWHGGGSPVMPVWHDVHRTCSATLLADETPTDRRPGQVLGQGVQPDIDHASIAFTARTLDVAGYVAVREPFRRTAGWVFVVDARRCGAIADDPAADDYANFQSLGDWNRGKPQRVVRGRDCAGAIGTDSSTSLTAPASALVVFFRTTDDWAL